MIKAKATTTDGKTIVILGLSRKNCELLLEGKPIVVQPEAVGLPDGPQIILMAGETEEAIAQELTSLLGTETTTWNQSEKIPS